MLKVKRLHKEAKVPTRAYQGDAGVDLYAIESKMVPVYKPGEFIEFANLPQDAMVEIKTGIAIEIPEGHYGEIKCRSSLGKIGIRVHSGVLDAGYRGEITVWMQNLGQKEYVVNKGDKIAQIIVKAVVPFEVTEVKELSKSVRGLNGHGSSGK
jgi:dUTP pyrophosphatase